MLPMNSDVEVSRTVVGVPISTRIQPSLVLLAATGGALGTLLRLGLTSITPSWHSINLGTVLVNLLGPLLLGILLQVLALGKETKFQVWLRVLLGVGCLGALTSYAELAFDVLTLLERGEVWLAISYGTLTLVAGAALTWLGIATASHLSAERASTDRTLKR